MLEKDTLVKVTNRNNGSLGYSIPDLNNLYRLFAVGETKELPVEEMRKLSYKPGGKTIIKEFLIIHNDELVKELLDNVEPEYYYTEKEVTDLLLNGSLDALKDCLDFAPKGTIELVKKLAIDLKINDISKRKAIEEATGLNITNAIDINEIAAAMENEPNGDLEMKPVNGRRTEAKAEGTKTRRVSAEPKVTYIKK